MSILRTSSLNLRPPRLLRHEDLKRMGDNPFPKLPDMGSPLKNVPIRSATPACRAYLNQRILLQTDNDIIIQRKINDEIYSVQVNRTTGLIIRNSDKFKEIKCFDTNTIPTETCLIFDLKEVGYTDISGKYHTPSVQLII